MTAVARLAALVDIMDHETCEVCVTRREVCVTPADARELLATIADLCPSHEACSYCGAALCVRCGIGEPPGTEQLCWHCPACRDRCPECQADLRDAMEAEQGDADRDEAACP
jgi:hypothetical protein